MLSNEDRLFLLSVARGDASPRAPMSLSNIGTPPLDELTTAARAILTGEVARLAKVAEEPPPQPDPALVRYHAATADLAELRVAAARREKGASAGQVADLLVNLLRPRSTSCAE